MSEQVTNQFIEALRTLEQNGDVAPMMSLYAEGAVVGNVIAPDHFHGPDGGRQFWKEYRGTFDTVASEFHNIIIGDELAALEWTTTGTSFQGAPFSYTGVTILEIEGSQITRSCAYFDPAALGHQIQE